MATMAEVIRRAIDEHNRLRIAWQAGAQDRAPPLPGYIAAAVAAHLLDPATVERAARAMWPDDPVTEEDVGIAHAAIRAALGEHEGVGRG